MSEQNDLSTKEGEMYITFNSYLDHLRSEEGLKPPSQRREVPTNRDLARAIRERHDTKLHEVTLSNMINGNVKLFNMETARLLLDEMWRRGFTPEITDFIKYSPPAINK